jgi:hypothetical protein
VTPAAVVTISCAMRAPALALLLALAPIAGNAADADPSRTHYLFAPSAFLLGGGEVVLRQTELLLTSVSVGIAGHLDVEAGTAMPALYLLTRSSAPNLRLAVKAGFSPSEVVHLAAGFDSLTLPAIMGGYGYAVASFGREKLHLTVGAGLPLLGDRTGLGTGPPLLLAAGAVGLGRHVVLATENWFFPTRPDLPMINAGVVRLLLWRVGLGLGAARVAPLRMPLPWIDLSFRIAG